MLRSWGSRIVRSASWTIGGHHCTMATALAVAAGYAVHRLRMRNVMQNEIRDIMYAPHSPPLLDFDLQNRCTARPVQ